MINLREYRHKVRGLPSLINMAFLVGEPPIMGRPIGIGLTKSSHLIAGFEYAGPDLDSTGPDDLEVLSAQINHAIARLGSGRTLHVDLIREPVSSYTPDSECHFPDPVTHVIDAERREQHQHEGAHFVSRYVAVFGYQIPTAIENRLVDAVISNKSAKDDGLNEHIKRFTAELENIVQIFSSQCKVAPLDSSGLMTHIHGCLTGDHHKLATPKIPAYLDAVIGAHDLVGGFEPKIDDKHIRVVSIAGWPSETFPEILENLSKLPFPLRYSIRYLFLDPTEAIQKLTVYRRNWFQKRHGLSTQISMAMGGEGSAFLNQDALSMTADSDTAIAEASSGVVRYGYMTANIIIHANDAAVANERVRQVSQHINNLGFVARVESVNAVKAWLGSVPGQMFENVRRPLMNTLNLADIMPTTSIWSGPDRNPNPMQIDPVSKRHAPPLLYGATTGNTPFRLSLHVDDVGHTFIAGPTGSGKSALLALLAAQHMRYENARVFAFDKGLSLLALTMACGGAHYEPGADSSTLAFAPLSRIDESPSERAWAGEWIEGLCVLQGLNVTINQRNAIHAAIEALAQSGDDTKRGLTEFANTVQNLEIRDALHFYASNKMLDAHEDSLELTGSRFSVFEIEQLLGSGNKIAAPVLLYLFHRIEKSLDGSPTLIILDEAWAMLDHPLFAAKIREWLKVLRKANAAVVFATQSLADLQNNPLRPVLMESCPTKILLPNTEAMSENLRPLYRDLGLNEWQTRLLRNSTPKSDYYVVTPNGRRRITLAVGPVALAFIGASDKKSLARIRELAKTHGDRWTVEWLRERLPRDNQGWTKHLSDTYDAYQEAARLLAEAGS